MYFFVIFFLCCSLLLDCLPEISESGDVVAWVVTKCVEWMRNVYLSDLMVLSMPSCHHKYTRTPLYTRLHNQNKIYFRSVRSKCVGVVCINTLLCLLNSYIVVRLCVNSSKMEWKWTDMENSVCGYDGKSSNFLVSGDQMAKTFAFLRW